MKSIGKSPIFTTKFQCFFFKPIFCNLFVQVFSEEYSWLPDASEIWAIFAWLCSFFSVTITLCLSICLHCVKSEWLLFRKLSSKTATNYQVSLSLDNGHQWKLLADQCLAFQNTYFCQPVPSHLFVDIQEASFKKSIKSLWSEPYMTLMHFGRNLCLSG